MRMGEAIPQASLNEVSKTSGGRWWFVLWICERRGSIDLPEDDESKEEPTDYAFNHPSKSCESERHRHRSESRGFLNIVHIRKPFRVADTWHGDWSSRMISAGYSCWNFAQDDHRDKCHQAMSAN
jgi:hypothetical protein